MSTLTLYERVGGSDFFERLTRRFYEGVAGDPVLRPLYPADDAALESSRVHLELFLIQYWGGPSSYNDLRGHPRLRMRHASFRVGRAERDAWVRHMTDSLRAEHLDQLDEIQMISYLSGAADHLVNDPG